MGITIVVSLLSGIALFLYGMTLMGEGLKKAAGNKLERILYRLTNTPVKGVVLGTAVTTVIQSSSATSVMVVGFVNSGMMKVSQAIGIIMGANIGTSATGWILCLSHMDSSNGVAQLLSTATIAAVVAVIGIIFKMFVKKTIYHNIGDVMLGFAILMVGMQMMSGAMDPLKENAYFIRALTVFSNPLMGILVGILFTAVLQSASASIGILQAVSVTGTINFATAFPIVLGIGVGAACPVLLSAIGTNRNGKRTALIYLLIDLLGLILWGTIFYAVHAIVNFAFVEMTMNPVSVALLNSVFRIATVVLLLPCIKGIEKLIFWLIKDTESDKEEQAYFDLLEEEKIVYPEIAISQSRLVMNGMIRKVRSTIVQSLEVLKKYSPQNVQDVRTRETIVDLYEKKLDGYLTRLAAKGMSVAQTKQVSKYLHIVNNLERMSNHSIGVIKVAEEIHEKKILFSDEAQRELDVIEAAVKDILDLTTIAFLEDDLEIVAQIEPLREWIRLLCKELKLRHVLRLQAGTCEMKQGVVYNDLLTDYERIGAHCANIAVVMVELEFADVDSLELLKSTHLTKSKEYAQYLEQYTQKYSLDDIREIQK